MRILIIEDEPKIAEVISSRLKKENYVVDINKNGEEGLDNTLTNIYDLIILDVMLPKINGFEILKQIRKEKIEAKVIMLTAKSMLDDKLTGFNSGANDYITKPFHVEELVARVNAQLRMNQNQTKKDYIEAGDIRLNTKTNEEIEIICKEFQIIEYLIKNPNSQTKIKTNKIIILGIEGLAIAILITYIALSKFNKLTLKETLKSTETKIIFIAITILLTTILTIGQIYIAQNIINKTNNTENTQMMPQEINNSSQTAEATGEKTITGETETLKEEYTTTDSDKSAILVENGGNATIEGATISKTGGDSTNTDAIINLKNCQLTYGSNTLISNKGTTEWGTTGTNGGKLTLNAENQTLKGNIEIDNISTLKMNLTNSQYTGTINGEQTAKQIDIKIDSNTKIKLTGNSYITSLEDEDTTYSNIDFNEYTLYVNGTAIN